ncbi:MAG: hypothetical protein HUJ55_01595 [Ileibacterium sp.]|nr:hypothetical protein [Ileibacterium sp.]
MPAENRVQEIKRQIELHNHLKSWLKASFVISTIAATLFWFSLKAYWLAAVGAGLLLAASLAAMLIIGYALYKSYTQIQGRIQTLRESKV